MRKSKKHPLVSSGELMLILMLIMHMLMLVMHMLMLVMHMLILVMLIILILQACPLLPWCHRASCPRRGTPTCSPGTPPPSQTSSSTKCSTGDSRLVSTINIVILIFINPGFVLAVFLG